VAVEQLSREGDRYLVTAGELSFEAEHVVVAMASYQRPKVPPFAGELDPGVVQLPSSDYRNLAQ
jgi:putative flavoprotein involved in K+ transport